MAKKKKKKLRYIPTDKKGDPIHLTRRYQSVFTFSCCEKSFSVFYESKGGSRVSYFCPVCSKRHSGSTHATRSR